MTLSIEAVGGSVAGRAHVRAGRNNQDAFFWAADGARLVAVVCDGCSGGAHSEAGAAIGCRLVAQAVLRHGPERAMDDVLAGLRALPLPVAEYLLFTVVGALVAPEGACAFSLGDGVIAWDGETIPLGPYPDNEPPYLAYALLDGRPRPFEIHRRGPVDRLLVGTDGALSLPNLEEFCDDRFFGNPDAVRRRLAVLSRTPGLLPDDTTLVALRRRP